MPKLSEIRAQFPMYADVPDEQLLIGLHRKFYSDMPFKQFNNAIEYDIKSDPTEGMSGLDKFRAGVGKSMVDTVQGLGQMVGLTSREDVAESRKLNAPLMATGAGKAGDIAGNVATTLPLAFVPGANTMKGASLIGAATGAVQPSVDTSETLTNIAGGGAGGAGGLLLGRGVAAGYQGVTGMLRPMTEKGREQIASEVLQRSATNAGRAAQDGAYAREIVPGSKPTMGQVANDPGLAQLERTLVNNPDTAGPLMARYAEQQEARRRAIGDIAGTAEHRTAIKEGREIFGRQDYDAARAAGVDPAMATAMQPQIDSLMRRPTMINIADDAKRLAADNDMSLTNMGSVDGLHWMKKALDLKIGAAQNPASASHQDLGALLKMKSDLMDTLEQIAPAYKTANDNYAGMSKAINAMDVAADLQKRLYKNAEWGSGKEMGSTYQGALSSAFDSVKKQTGMNKGIEEIMTPSDLKMLEAVARDLSRKEAGQTMGRAVGSPTMQNMMGQNMVDRIAGPLGMPQSFSQSVLASAISRPYNFVMKSAQPQISAVLAEAMADPKRAAQLLKMVQQPSKLGALSQSAEKYLPIPGILAGNGSSNENVPRIELRGMAERN